MTLSIVWHDDVARSLAAAGQTVAERRQAGVLAWRLERLRPAEADCAPVGTPEGVLATAASAAELGAPAPLAAIAGYEGMLHVLRPTAEEGLSAVLLIGEMRAATSVRSACRLLLTGPAPAVLAVALALADTAQAQVPDCTLAAEAYAMARVPIAPRRLGVPVLPSGLDAEAACRFVCAHLADVIQHHARQIRPDQPEAVHQIRVAARRLRATLAVFRRAAGGTALEQVRAGLQEMARMLGPARDWDVFLAETGRLIDETFGEEPSIHRMLVAAVRRRDACYAALDTYFDSPHFRRLGIELVAFAMGAAGPTTEPTGKADPPSGAVHGSARLRSYAAHALARRLLPLVKLSDDVMHMPIAALHGLRLQAKRLRYAAEVFAPLFPQRKTGKFIRRLQRLQECLGTLNDGSVAAALMNELGAAGRGFAAGAVRGMVAGRASGGREEIADNLRKLKHTSPFWD